MNNKLQSTSMYLVKFQGVWPNCLHVHWLSWTCQWWINQNDLKTLCSRDQLNSSYVFFHGVNVVIIKNYHYILTIGLLTDSTSSGFIVDITAPEITEGPKFSPDFGILGNAQFYRTVMKVEWKVKDTESSIQRQYLSLKSHRGGEFDLASTKVCGHGPTYGHSSG